jgi:hypothetical protein
MIVAPRKRRRRFSRLLWAVGAVLLGVLGEPAGLARVSFHGLLGVTGIVISVIAALGLFSLNTDPRHAAAYAFALISFGLQFIFFQIHVGGGAYALLALTTLVPMLLLAGAAARLISARRGLPG